MNTPVLDIQPALQTLIAYMRRLEGPAGFVDELDELISLALREAREIGLEQGAEAARKNFTTQWSKTAGKNS